MLMDPWSWPLRVILGIPWILHGLPKGFPYGSPSKPFHLHTSLLLMHRACAQKQASGNSPQQEPLEPQEPPEPPKWCQERWLGPHLPHTPGARMTAVTQTPSNELIMTLVSFFGQPN